MLLMFGSVVGFVVFEWKQGTHEMEVLATRDVMAVCKDWDADVMFGRLDSVTKRTFGRDRTKEALDSYSQLLGPINNIQSVKVVGAFLGSAGGTRTVRCRTQFRNAEGIVTIVYKKEGGQWMIYTFRIDPAGYDDNSGSAA